MGWRFRKSVKILPGVRLNFGKKGFTSASVGGKYAKTNISKKGTYNTYSLPGTGLSYRTKTNSGSNFQQNNYVKPLSEVYWNCNKCLMINFPETRFCEGCGIENLKIKLKTNGLYWYCSGCFSGNIPETSYCRNCGLIHQSKISEESISNNQNPAKIVLSIIFAATLILILFAVGGFAQDAKVISENANLRGTPTESGKVVEVLSVDSNLKIIVQKGVWFLVQSTDYAGWIHGNTIKLLKKPSIIDGFDIEEFESRRPVSKPKTTPTRTRAASRSYIRGARGGCYYINGNGNKTYVSRSLCN